MARKYRAERIADEIRRIIAHALQFEYKDPRLPFLTSVTEVRMNSDLSVATVLFSIPGDETQQAAGLEILDHSKGFFRTKVAKGLTLRHAPELVFALDRSMERGARIDAKLAEIRQEREERESLKEEAEKKEAKAAKDADNANSDEASEVADHENSND